MRRLLALAVLGALLLTGCAAPTAETAAPVSPAPSASPPATPSPTPVPTPTPEPTPTPDPIRERVEAMSDGELAGQLLIVGMEGTAPAEDARAAIRDLRVSGIILFKRNVESETQLASLNAALRSANEKAGNPPLLLCVDEEGGNVSRLARLEGELPTPYDSVQTWLADPSADSPGDYGRALALRCAKYGFNVDFAPCLDVWSNPDNRVIAKRSYGSDAENASLAVQAAAAMLEEGVVPVGKHFPGHGDTDVDSHTGLPVVDKTLAQLEELELVPFRSAIREGIPALMAAHVLLSQVDPQYPASLSPAVIDGLLRQELGFDGVIFTDDLTMGAVSQGWTLAQAVVLAVNAGCDQLLVCHGADNARTAYDALVAALADGSLSRQKARECVYRVLTLKEKFT